MTKNRKQSDKTRLENKKKLRKRIDKGYLERKMVRGWKRIWIPPELVEAVKKMIAEYKKLNIT